MKKAKSISQLKKILDKYFSIYIRQRDNGICFTCGSKKEWKYQQCGHFISRSHNATRYDETNSHCQDARCNIFLYGNLLEYRRRIIKKYGKGYDEILEKRARTTYQFSTKELLKKIEFYKAKVKETGCA